MPKKIPRPAADGRRITVALDARRLAIVEELQPQDGTPSDAIRAVIDLAARADEIDVQNRRLAEALTIAMTEMAAALTEIRAQVARLERG